MIIKQLNGTYFPNDDRIIFRFNTLENSEFKFWLTRRITHFILETTSQHFLKQQQETHGSEPYVAKAISEFQQQAVKETADLSTPFSSGTQFPIGSDAVLVLDAHSEMIIVDDQDIFALDLILPGGGILNLKLTMQLMRGLVLLLEQLNKQAKWGEPIAKPLPTPAENPETKKIH